MTACFACCWRPPDASGGRHWSLSNPRRSSAGIALWLRRRRAQRSGRNRAGRPPLDPAVARLLTDMASANPLWGAPRIHGELRKLGIEISERTVSRLLAQLSRPPSQPWRTFLANLQRHPQVRRSGTRLALTANCDEATLRIGDGASDARESVRDVGSVLETSELRTSSRAAFAPAIH